jgi:predicted O-linked N-acetylglucosamine transferase (SPINDLY family)
LRLKPGDAAGWEQRLYTFSYHPDLSAEQIYAEFVRWGDRFPDPVVDFSAHDRTPGRRLRIGYVSPDFRRHTSRFFFWPLFANHDPAAVELYAYSNVKIEDDVTGEFKGLFDHWRNIRGVSDDEAARMIREDRIDILVDCCNHMRDDRLGVFTLKPAPIQATWLGAAWTTGLKMVDYALIDPYMAPEGTLTREAIVRLPHCFVAYRPPEQTAEIAPPPCLENGHITFGYSGRTERLNHRTFRVWGEILKQNPTARLILDYRTFSDPPTQTHYRQFMDKHGMDISRVIMRKSENIFAGLNDIDILLDCFPHSGGTMLFDALWMGVPILTLSSRPPVGRIGTSLMINLGLPEWVAESEEGYIGKACAFAQNHQSLAQLRAGMRERMQNSPIMDGAGFARGVEEAYRGMFEKWVHHQHHGLRGEAMDVQPMPLEERKSKKLYPKSETKEHTKTARPDKLTRKATIYGSVEPSADDVNVLVVLFNQRRYVEMEIAARQLLIHYPKYGVGWKALGTALSQQGRTAEALEPMRKAVAFLPGDADAYNNLGNVLREQGALSEAEANYLRAIKIRPDYAEAHSNFGVVAQEQGRFIEAEANHRKALKIRPDYAEAHNNLGIALKGQGRLPEAEASYLMALKIRPDYAEAHNNLGVAAQEQGLFFEAEASYRQALKAKPDYAEAHNHLGSTLQEQGHLFEAENSYRYALEFKPDYAEAHCNLGNIFKEQGRFCEAEVSLRNALEIKPDYVEVHYNLGNTLSDMSRLDEAEASYRRALEIKPGYEDAFGNLLFAQNYHPDKSGEEIFAAYREYDARFGLPHRSEWQPHGNSRETRRRLKVGYVSPDFKKHSVRHFLEPLLAHHDQNALEVYAYAELSGEDEVTARYKGYVAHWVNTTGMSDVTLTERIRADGIDILVELAGHTNRNRLGIFARKPAPVSVSWLGYGYTSGLTAIDYLLTDQTSAPRGSENVFSETPWRLATPGYVYRPAEDMGEISRLPATSAGYVTFGTLTRGIRINHRVIRVWSEILKRVEGARLVIDSKDFREARMQDMLAEKFAAHGVSRDRLQIGFHSPPWDTVRGIDIGLDCFPHNSGTTLFESLYMGVPYITLAGRPSVGRIGSSVLEGVGHPEWIAGTEEEYVEKAVALAEDLPGLAALRAGLRQEMQAGPLMDEPAFARKVEGAYRGMFEKWAHTQQGPQGETQIAGSSDAEYQQAESLPDLAETSLRNHSPSPQEMNTLVTLFAEGRYTEAAALAQSMTEQFPLHGFGWKALGTAFNQMGRNADALAPMQKAAALLSGDAETHSNLGNTYKGLGRLNEAEMSYRQALQIKPDYAEAHSNLSSTLQELGRLNEAEASCRWALQIKPDYADAHNNLGNILQDTGRLGEAEASYRRSLEINPDCAEVFNNLGVTLQDMCRLNEAEACFLRALEIKPDDAGTYTNLCNTLQSWGRLAEAEAVCRRALQIKPDFAEAHNNLGNILMEMACMADAEASYRQALQIKPDYAEAYNNLSNTLQGMGRLNEAEVSCRRSLEINPDCAEAFNNLGIILQDMSRLDEAEASYRRALEIKPDYEDAYGNLLFVLNYHPDKSGEEIFEAYREYDARFGLPHRSEWQPHGNSRETRRRLKVGYVSPDFKKHSVRHFLEPLLAHHDQNAVEVYAYAELSGEDEVTARYKGYVAHWVNTTGMSDTALAGRIRADGIDILVELAGHTNRNRLGVFARKPAPVSVSWLGYGYTSGLTAIDYLLTDQTSAPPGSENVFSETPWRLATPGYVYRPAEDMGEVSRLPAMGAGHVTFGTLTRGIRINHRVIRVWSEILKRVEGARLVIDSKDFREARMRDMLAEKFAAHGVSRDRLQIGFHSPPWDTVRGIDIGLDCFPHNSGTTLFESLYMGVPYITLAGRPSVGRIGSSVLEGVGHPEWIGGTEEEYVEKAVALAGDLPGLAALRAGLRQEMRAGPLMDEPAFARKVEDAYRGMFEKWAQRE